MPVIPGRISVGTWRYNHTTDGGSLVTGSDQTCVLDEEVFNDITGASLSSNQVTLPPGRYLAWAHVPANNGLHFRAILYDATAAADIYRGPNQYGSGATFHHNASLMCSFSLSSSSDIEVRYRAANAQATNGLGIGTNFGDDQIYTELTVARIG